MQHKVDITIQVNPVLNQSSESGVESEMFAHSSQGLGPAGGVGTNPVPTHWPLCDVTLPTLTTRAGCLRAT